MLFKRRQTESLLERVRVHLWPRRSWNRSGRYIVYRLRRLSATPHAIALGFAAGAFAAVTPYIGTHMVMAALLAWIIGGSVVASVLGRHEAFRRKFTTSGSASAMGLDCCRLAKAYRRARFRYRV